MIDINLSKVSKSYGFDKILDNIDLTVQKGEKVALIGANGCGKSTILKIVGKEENVSSGEVSIRKGASVGYLSQVPIEIDIKVSDYIYDTFNELIKIKERLEKLENNLSSDIKVINKYTRLQEEFINLGGYEFETKISKVLAAFDITDEMLNRNFNTLSGGEKTICSLIKLLLIEPDILLLDEPTNHLDIKRIEWLERFLKGYKGTVVIVSHDRYCLDKVVNKIILLTKRGLEIYFGNYTYFIKESENRLMLEFKKYKDQQKIIEAMKKSIKRLQEYGRLCSPSGGEIFFRRAASIKKRLEKIEKIDKPETKKKINIDFNDDSRTGKEVLKIKKLNLSFSTKVLLEECNLDLFYKEKVCLIGENGTGKSTLIKEILKGNNNIKLGSNIKLGYIPQEIIFENNNLSILEESRKYFIGDEEHLRSALFKFLFVGENIHKKIKYLSGGEKVRLKLFCLIQNKYNFLILDEPTNHIDMDTREILENALIDFNGTILFVSHDRYFINKIATNIVELKYKKLNKYIGNYDVYLNSIKKM
ncbi:MAG: ABC-F family ATP-binding cassette domain-containing protein [Bacilli bacterium]|nr:ABC-F family ATP-binding cassette domain-containing protein [Bacilli bacterium]